MSRLIYAPKGLGTRQLAVLHHLAEHGATDLDQLGDAVYGTRHRRDEVRRSVTLLQARKLVRVKRSKSGEMVSVSLVSS